MGVLIGIGALINKSTFEGGSLIRKGALIGSRALNRIITVVAYIQRIKFLSCGKNKHSGHGCSLSTCALVPRENELRLLNWLRRRATSVEG